ncbi:MAG: alpha-amylase family glycosyl hydrolase [Elusimicrobiales bacterium]
MRPNPHVLEINTRCWLRQLRDKYGAPLTLASVPDEEWQELKHLGFDAVWLMGVWRQSPKGRDVARATPDLLKAVAAFRPDYDINDIAASPYAVRDYTLDPALGAEGELALLRAKLNGMGIGLFLDFVSNHLALDHALLESAPDCFIQAGAAEVSAHPDWFFESAPGRFTAYGRDPNFPPWQDTAQLNYFNPRARAFMLDTLKKIASVCDGVRCDMVMLNLNDIHDATWGRLLGKNGFARPETEFWDEAIRAVKEEHPHFTFMAEVYWGLEWRLQEMGFDYTYDKVLYDRMRLSGPVDVKSHLRAEKLYQKRSVRFLENHDEAPAVSAFGREKSIASAVAMATLRGMRLFYQPQIKGMNVKSPIQYSRADFPEDPFIGKLYSKIIKIADHPAFHGGEWALVEPRPAAPGDAAFNNLLCWSWHQRRTYKLIIVNYSQNRAAGRVPVNASAKGDSYAFFDELSDIFMVRAAGEVRPDGLLVDLPPYGAHMLDLEF